MASIDDEWTNFLNSQRNNGFGNLPIKTKSNEKILVNDNIESSDEDDVIVPTCEDLYISTKTKVLFLNQEVDIQNVFWDIPVIEYWKPESGVVKKQMKIVSKNQELIYNF
jgi:hypothetical protein